MTRLIAFAALLGLTTANLTGFGGPKGVSKNDLAGISAKPFALRATCTSLEIECDGTCIPSGSECCSNNDGSYCEAGRYCTSEGCCEDGEICTGTAAGCDDGRQLCGEYCVPEDAVCCLDGSYCNSGETCTGDGRCEKGSGSGGSSGSGSGSGSGGSGGSSDSSDSSDDSESDEPTETLISQPTGTAASGDDDDGKTLCTRKSRGGSSDSDGDSDDSSGDGGDDGCGGENSGPMLAPSLGGVLLAVFVFML